MNTGNILEQLSNGKNDKVCSSFVSIPKRRTCVDNILRPHLR